MIKISLGAAEANSRAYLQVLLVDQWVEVEYQNLYLNRRSSSIKYIIYLRNGKKVTVTKTTIQKADGTTEVTETVKDGANVTST